MSTRTRIRTRRVNPDSQTTDVFFWSYPSGYVGSETKSFDYRITSVNPPWLTHEHETIIDEVVEGRGIKNVTHVKTTPPAFDSSVYFGPSGGNSRVSADSPNYQHTPTRSYEGPSQAQQIWLAGGGKSPLYNYAQGAGLASDASSVAPPDRLGELPAKVVRRLEEWHATTTAWEMQELPALARMFVARNGLLRNLIKYGVGHFASGDFPRAMQRLVSLYREGQLTWSFGIMPTIQDLKNISDCLRKPLKDKRKVLTVTIIGSGQKSSSTMICNPGVSTYALARVVEASDRIRIGRVDGVRCTFERSPIQFSNDLQAMIDKCVGVNPMGLIWEVLPFSWAVDALLKIDDALDNLWLASNSSINSEFWSSTTTEFSRTMQWAPITGIVPTITLPGQSTLETYEERLGSSSSEFRKREYSRGRRLPPTVGDSIRLFTGAKSLYMLFLVALGFHRGMKIPTKWNRVPLTELQSPGYFL